MSNLATQQQEGEERPSGMSSSGSSASLTSESSFDPNDPETYSQPGSSSASKPAPLGIVEIARMARNDRKARKASQSPVQERGPILLLSPPVSPGVNSAMGMLGEGDVFARDVVIKGWKIVGGKGFGDKAKVGAYVVYDIELITKSGGSISIMRRYTDFVNLREGLKARYPNLRAAIPKLPGRVHMSKFSEKLLADRQPRLQRFLRTILLHPDMGRGGVGSVVGEWVISGTTHSAHATSPAAGGQR